MIRASQTHPRAQARVARRRGRAGFTLVELLVAVVILVVLSGIAIAAYSSTKGIGLETTIRTDLTRLQGAAQEYYQNHGAYPNMGWQQTEQPTLAFRPSAGAEFQVSDGTTYAVLYVRSLGSPAGWCYMRIGNVAGAGDVTCVNF